MEVRIVRAAQTERDTLRNLAQLYSYDFSEISGLEIEENGRFEDPPFDAYWRDTWRFPFFIRAGSRLAGFALLQRKSRLSGADDVWDMAEFFVLRRHRRVGVGLDAACQLFARHQGQWEVRQREENVAATAFWRKAIGASTGGRFVEEIVDDERWRGPVQRFSI